MRKSEKVERYQRVGTGLKNVSDANKEREKVLVQTFEWLTKVVQVKQGREDVLTVVTIRRRAVVWFNLSAERNEVKVDSWD